MSASALRLQPQGVSIITLTNNVSLPSPFTSNTYYLSGQTASQVDYIDGGAGVSFNSSTGAIVFAEPGVYEITSQLQAITPADLSASTGEGMTFLKVFTGGGGASCQVKTSIALPTKPSILDPAGEWVLNCSGLVNVTLANGYIIPTLDFTTGGLESAGTIGVNQNATFVIVKRIV